ncbi:uncharacterized protein LOC131153131 [Malania oleifera]|uniref:uncharacterized protein LOC131153131 n=1 Tax=Malania oleifera TaxID=397392 RepID=UPI0025AE8655|nr:uncharacterized protein LOC131153131 [Malania oleifera]
MEGVGARLGRSSTRYGPATVFNGPVRKWKKKWVHVSPSGAAAAAAAAVANNLSQTNNGTNGNNGSHLLLYKWTPISQSSNNSNGDKSSGKDAASAVATTAATEEPPRRRFKYVPIAVLEEQKNEAAEKADDEAKPIDTDPSEAEPTSKSNGFDEKPDINDVPMEESQAIDIAQVARQDLNESLDLSLGLMARDGDHDSDSKPDGKDGELERVNSGSVGT